MKIAVATLGERFSDRDIRKSLASVATHLCFVRIPWVSTPGRGPNFAKGAPITNIDPKTKKPSRVGFKLDKAFDAVRPPYSTKNIEKTLKSLLK